MSAPAQPAPGPVHRDLVANVDRLRQARRMSWRSLSAALAAAGRPVPPLGLHRLLQGGRRVDVDELTALAQVLGVTPEALLSSPDTAPDRDHPAVRAARDLTERITELLASGDPAAGDALSGYVDRALRRVQIEVEELLADREVNGACAR